MMTASCRRANSNARALLPLAVGPAISATAGRSSEPGFWREGKSGLFMFVATIVASDALRQGDISAARDRLAAASCEPGEVREIDPGKAADILFSAQIGRASCRGKSVSVRVYLGGRRSIKKKKMRKSIKSNRGNN